MSAVKESVSVVVVTFGEQPLLTECIESISNSIGVQVEILIVDNGHVGPELAIVADRGDVRVFRPGVNLGFAAGCNFGVKQASGDYVALINPDAVVNPDSLWKMIAPLGSREVELTTATLVLYREPHLINAIGNQFHPCGVSWCGSYRLHLAKVTKDSEVLLASGAAMACTRRWWNDLQGFQEEFFAYYEDTEFSFRTRLRGAKVLSVSQAIVRHDYEFSRNPNKLFLVDRNRMMLVLALYRGRSLLLMAPLIAVHETALTIVAIASGWGKQRLRAVRWLFGNRAVILRLRHRLQVERKIGDAQLLERMTTVLVPENLSLAAKFETYQRPLQFLTSMTVRLIRRTERKFGNI